MKLFIRKQDLHDIIHNYSHQKPCKAIALTSFSPKWTCFDNSYRIQKGNKGDQLS